MPRIVQYYQRRADLPLQSVRVILSPIKSRYAADAHREGDRWFFVSGAFHPESVVHEFLHLVLHPLVKRHGRTIDRHSLSGLPIDGSYYLEGTTGVGETPSRSTRCGP